MQSRVLILFVSLVLAATAIARADRSEKAPERMWFSEFPARLGDWQGQPAVPLEDKVLKILGLTDYLNRVYVAPDQTKVGLYVGYWGSQRQGETIHSPQNCLPGSGWEPLSRTTVRVPDPGNPAGPGLPVNRYLIQQGNERQLVLYWFQSHGRIVASEYWSKFYLIADSVRLNRSDGALVRVVVPVENENAGAEQRAEALALRFVQDLLPRLGGFLPN